MRKYIITVCGIVFALLIWNVAHYRLGMYVDLNPKQKVETFVHIDEEKIYMEKEGKIVPFEIRGMDMGTGIPGQWGTDFAITEEIYLRWFEQIQEMGINTIRVYTVLNEDFYNAFYRYNKNRETPLYLLHGIWINDYIFHSHADAYDEELFDKLLTDSRTMIDVLHGERNISLGYEGVGTGRYRKDVSQWVLGYILGVEWDGDLVAYTNQKNKYIEPYKGKYLYAEKNARPFENFLCELGDKVIAYETGKYKEQRLISFENGALTDPFVYSPAVADYRNKFSCVDVERIKSTNAFKTGMFASYHAYAHFPDYLKTMQDLKEYTEEEIINRMGISLKGNLEYRLSMLEGPSITDYLTEGDYYDRHGRMNTYCAYLRALNKYHSIPIVISEYGVPTARGMAQEDFHTGRDQGRMTEKGQGQALIECYEDIIDSGCVGSCLFSWQDEWFKKSWNTHHAVKMDKRPYWSDYQTSAQSFGVLTFDPGKEESICYVDGDISEWKKEDVVSETSDMKLSMKYDEKFIYFLVEKENFNPEQDILYIPIDITPKTGSTYSEEQEVRFEKASDFLMIIQGKTKSKLLVQQRYNAIRSTYNEDFFRYNNYFENHMPEKESPIFEPIELPISIGSCLRQGEENVFVSEKYETGLLYYGNANPKNKEFDSLADYIFSDNCVEIRIPWGLLNFSSPSEMLIHDDYYENYGVENLKIDHISVGCSYKKETMERIQMNEFALKGWGKKVTAHERLKDSYYILKKYWTSKE